MKRLNLQKKKGMISYIDPVTNEPVDYSIDKLYNKQNVYHIVNSIPRFVPSDNYAEAFGLQWNTYKKTQLDSFTGYNFTFASVTNV